MRSAHLEQALEDFTEVITISNDAIYRSDRDGRINLTQLAEVYRRICEEARYSGDKRKTIESISSAATVLDQGIDSHGFDFQICLALIDVGDEFLLESPDSKTEFPDVPQIFAK